MFFQCILAAVLVAQGCLGAMNERITDGQEAPPHQFPHQVSIVWGVPPLIKYRHVCGGSIINENWILTAGHCVTELPWVGRMQVMAGKHIINQHEDGQQVVGVELKVVHWKYPGGVAQHDIAMLRLKTPLMFNENIKPIMLPKKNVVHAGDVVLSGWGSVSKNIIPKLPTILQTATIPLIDTETCAEIFDEFPGDAEVFDTQVCTGPIGGTVSACSGDSGGPLIQYDDEAVPELVGIVSWGSYPCGSGTPSVYTRVASYIDWINDKLYTM